MFTVYFRNSTTTPPQPGLRTLVDAALSDCGATWTGEEAELRMADGSLLYLFGEDEEDGMLLEYPVLTEAVAAAVYAIADRTSAFTIDDPFNPSAIQTEHSVGEARAADMSIGGFTKVDGPAAVHAWLSDIPENGNVREATSSRPRAVPKPKSAFEDQTFLGKLADAIFGKKI